jgi:hypothetical protein
MLLMSPDYSLTEELVEVWTNRLIFSTGGFHLFAGAKCEQKEHCVLVDRATIIIHQYKSIGPPNSTILAKILMHDIRGMDA